MSNYRTSPAYMNKTTLWRLTWSHALGVRWMPMRVCDLASAESWKAVYQSDESNALFTIAKKAPQLPDNAQSLALHPASL